MSLPSSSQQPDAGLVKLLKDVYSKITIEPITFLGFTIYYLTEISAQALYLDKVCQVNLGHSGELCSNLTEDSDLQVQTQEYVSGVQAHNSFLQARGPETTQELLSTRETGPLLKFNLGQKTLSVKVYLFFVGIESTFMMNTLKFSWHLRLAKCISRSKAGQRYLKAQGRQRVPEGPR